MLLSPVLAEEASGIGALGIDGISLLVYVVNFGILLVLLYLVAYKPILRMLDQRRQTIQGSLDEADRVRQEAQQQREELEQRLQEGRQESQRMLDQARQVADQVREQEMQRARDEAERLTERAREEIQRERDQAVAEVRRQFADLAIQAAEQVIGRSLDRDAHRELVEKALEESTGLGRN